MMTRFIRAHFLLSVEKLAVVTKHGVPFQGKSVLETAQFGNPTRQRVEHGISWLTRRLTVKLMFPNLKICVALGSFLAGL
jgi:hypothetical protein